VDQPTNPATDDETLRTTAQTVANLPRQARAQGKFWDLAFHFWRRVAWSHKVTSYSELFRCAQQVRTPVSE
jgi:hypothetical protein